MRLILEPAIIFAPPSPFDYNKMGSNHTSQIIRNRHFTTLQIRSQESEAASKMIGSVAVMSSIILQTWIKKLELVKKQNHFHMLLPLSWKVAKSNICGSNKVIEIEYQKFSRLLSQQIQLRSEQNRHLEESQIWYLVWALTQVADQCSKYGERIYNVCLNNIFMNETGNIKILTPFSLPDPFNPYFEPDVQDVYFSPQELKGRRIGQMYNESDQMKSSSFAIGMLLLSLTLLKPLYQLYDYTNNQINVQMLKLELQNLSKIQIISEQFNTEEFHSEPLQKVIRRMVEIDPSKRVTASQVYEGLKPFINQIAQLQAFQFQVPQPYPSSPPKKERTSSKEAIRLKSQKLRTQSYQVTPQTKSNLKVQKSAEVSPPPLVQSKYVAESSAYSGLDFLKKIDERLQRSREQFPS